MKEYKFNINGSDYSVSVSKIEDNTAQVVVNGTEYSVEVEGMGNTPKTPKVVQPIATPTGDAHPAVVKTAKPSSGGGVPVKSPLPGVILDLKVKVGDSVKVGQQLLVLEAMKMENNIDSDKEGVVQSISVQRGDSVLEGDTLLIIG